MNSFHSKDFPCNGDGGDSQSTPRLSHSDSALSQDIMDDIPSMPDPSKVTTTFNPDHTIITGLASLRPDNIEGGIAATKLRCIRDLSHPQCLAGKAHISNNEVGDKTVMGISEWESADAISDWLLGNDSNELWRQVVDFVQPDSIGLHQWKPIPDPRMMQSSYNSEATYSSVEIARIQRAARLWDKSLSEEAFAAMLWFRPTKGREAMLIKTLWEIKFSTETQPVGSSIRFDICTGFDPDIEGVIMVYVAFENEQYLEQHLVKENNILGERVCQHLDSTPLLTTWKTMDLLTK